MTHGDIAVIIDMLPGMGDGVGIIHPTLPVPDDFHVSADAFIAHDGVTVHINPHDGQIGRVKLYVPVGRREIVHDRLDASPQD